MAKVVLMKVDPEFKKVADKMREEKGVTNREFTRRIVDEIQGFSIIPFNESKKKKKNEFKFI